MEMKKIALYRLIVFACSMPIVGQSLCVYHAINRGVRARLTISRFSVDMRYLASTWF